VLELFRLGIWTLAVKLFIVGSTGRTGLLLTERALAKGHSVTAFGRRQPPLTEQGLRYVAGDPQRAAELETAISGHDAVVSCLGQRSRDDAGVLAGSASAVLTAMRSSAAAHYVVVSQGLLFPSANPIVFLLRTILARHIADSTAMEDALRNSNAAWTIVRPPRLVQRSGLRGFRVALATQPKGAGSMGYGDLAACMLDIVERRAYVREIVGVTSA
jgi:putative NADH-flavin reductase